MRKLALLFVLLNLLLLSGAKAQIFNANPDPNGEPWWVGGFPEITPEIQAEIDAIPLFQITSKSLLTELPDSVDNSKLDYFRSIFDQVGGSCGLASGVGYAFTYEINRLRNRSADDSLPENQYPTHYAWNYLNGGTGMAGFYYAGWRIIKDNGCPNVLTWGGYGWRLQKVDDGLR